MYIHVASDAPPLQTCHSVLNVLKNTPLGSGASASPGFTAGIQDTHIFNWERHHSPIRLALTPLPPALLGKEGFQGCQQATGPQAVRKCDASVNGCRSKAKELVHRVAQLLHTVNDFPTLLVSKQRLKKAASD